MDIKFGKRISKYIYIGQNLEQKEREVVKEVG